MVQFKTIRQTADLGILSERQLRLMVAQERCPGIRVGNRFMVNVAALEKQLEDESRQAVRKERGECEND